MKEKRLAKRHVVLLGLGHTNAHILKMWKMHPIPDTDLTCISDHAVATYSGMLPAVLAGQIPSDSMEIDLVRFCASVDARLVVGTVLGINHERQEIAVHDRPPIPFDVLSVGIGSVPTTADVVLETSNVLQIKPMQTFLKRLNEQRARLQGIACPCITVVGGGVAGMEILFCLPGTLHKLGIQKFKLRIVSRGSNILGNLAARTQRLVRREIQAREIELVCGQSVTRVDSRNLELDDGTQLSTDLVLWATGARAPDLLAQLSLPMAEDGFLATDHTLRCLTETPVFAVGDSGTISNDPLPKAGVYAVRQGPVLWQNLQRTLAGSALKNFVPQRSFLKLINLGDGRAVGEWKRLSVVGRLPMWLKTRIDGKFMEQFAPRPAMSASNQPMQCNGCGCKLGSKALERALQRSTVNSAHLDDAAPIGDGGETGWMASTDFFSSPFSDGFTSGRIAALHSASDLLSMGCRVTEALANVVLPEGDGIAQQKLLADFLAGASQEFASLGANIVGGHTIVGPRMEAGFTVIGTLAGKTAMRKENLRTGDQLLLTKPLGIGVLLAAHMRSACRAASYRSLLETMLAQHAAYAMHAVHLGVRAATDVTGFGLAGHLLEMLDASDVSAQIHLDKFSFLPGSVEAVAAGIESSLIAENLRVADRIRFEADMWNEPRFRLLFDPQTCGGLLFGVPQEKVSSFVDHLAAAKLAPPIHIGVIRNPEEPSKPLVVVR